MHAYCRVAILRPTLVARDRRLLACSWIGPTAPSHFGSWSDCGLTVNDRHLSLLSSGPEDFHLRALPEPYVNLSIHTAPIVRPFPWHSDQWARSLGFARRNRSNQSLAPLV